MAFPTTIDAFTAVVDNVDYYQATHINTLQTAIVAAETAIGAGAAGPTSAATVSTIAKRDSTGFAKFTNKCCRGYNNAAGSLATGGAWVPVVFNVMRYDTASWWTAGSPTYFTVPVSGIVRINGHVHLAANGTGRRKISIELDGATTLCVSSQAGVAGDDAALNITTEIYLNAGQAIRLMINQDSGSALAIRSYAQYSPELAISVV